ncbi:hypothetical protein [Mycobacterium sp.]|uniref:hypothetical protein n=1 Tax=Mycobacterium sp. TaxID=1785 RepID=UPI003BA95A5F
MLTRLAGAAGTLGDGGSIAGHGHRFFARHPYAAAVKATFHPDAADNARRTTHPQTTALAVRKRP